jgi:hypothetical protein
LKGKWEFVAGETKNGKLCNVCDVQPMLVVWILRAGDDNINDVIIQCSVVVVDHFSLKIVAIY